MAKNIMFQGTGSSVGKSILTAGLCRVLVQDGYKTAPFKSQNMALNSFVTKDGKEMGRAQVVQAEAAGIEPTVDMNPILLKPTSDVGSQVIINGEVHGNVKAFDYYKKKPELKKCVLDAYNNLDEKFDLIVIEGAGSPAEINLRDNDIVNMGMAEMVDAPVLLIGDIDRGGVFASIYGTLMLLSKEEQERVKGFVINKFRGNVDILMPGVRMLEEKINKPCLGVIPYIDLNIDDEDSVTERFRDKGKGDINIGVIKLPYISNFSDFTPLELEHGINVKYILNSDDFENIDLLIIPGSKNTIKDMRYLYDTGFDRIIYKLHRKGIPVIGICGGYQILGQTITDPDSIESNTNKINGLGLLNTNTIITATKETKQISGIINEELEMCKDIKDTNVCGYEIHMGQTTLSSDTKPFITLEDGRNDGAVNKKGNVVGTYLHGIFENDEFRKAIIKHLMEKKGLELKENDISYNDYKNREYDKLADLIRENLDIAKVKEIMGL
ncbi:cobyric acid synthase [Abyssisolibacter fermentans]|uniref:cobyric acid synthase n=1 Tax=Abyssisolibacter fermentans TaxID=1766203 RepID=UPI0008364573|nr:cobyric acid synthase [Abyssisolibacter fermentans]